MKQIILMLSGIVIILFASSCNVTGIVAQKTQTSIHRLTKSKLPQITEIEVTTNQPDSFYKMSVARIASLKTGQRQVVEKGGALAKNSPVSVNKGLFESGIDSYPQYLLLDYAKGLKKYAVAKNFDTTRAFIINMAIRSGKKRFFVINLQNMTIENAGIVSHGNAGMRFSPERSYSNAHGSNCTSLGKYKIGNPYMGGFGLAYKLYGLDAGNSNAYERGVVLHAMGCVPYRETDMPSCQSEGCPAVSVQFLIEIQKIIDRAERPVLLWILDSSLENNLVKK